ncbi:hypothetical protein HYPSUDRAFT_65146 [Hypholoma sublateritium FD-334 SS-4]|uniref:CFEM domain-containing protein n=1 Tax=Hypholoma sublateritium (strain FD-334 SS-4) TaxID=945553 RepID=A0A0D2P860_HYPSF|nr:hypothetical protein HYPSUDRAFT_65146 [Hypholoma sublateritium FD-334 SS-4]
MFFTRVSLIIIFLAVTLHAQTINEIKQTPPCILNCIVNAAAEAGCPLNVENATCECASPQFQNSSSICLNKFCTGDEIKAAADMQAKKCSTASLNSSGMNTTNSTTSNPPTQANFRSAALVLTNSGVVSVLGVIFVGFLYV